MEGPITHSAATEGDLNEVEQPRLLVTPVGKIATHAAVVGATTQPSDAVLGPCRVFGDY